MINRQIQITFTKHSLLNIDSAGDQLTGRVAVLQLWHDHKICRQSDSQRQLAVERGIKIFRKHTIAGEVDIHT